MNNVSMSGWREKRSQEKSMNQITAIKPRESRIVVFRTEVSNIWPVGPNQPTRGLNLARLKERTNSSFNMNIF